jgi:ribose/xylose/arabinose/galactoside ABC-type transport system permease subunit
MERSGWSEVRQRLSRHREWSVFLILCLEILVFYIILYPEEAGTRHTFFNLDTFSLIFRNSSVYGIAAIGAAMIITGGGIDLSPGAIIALTTVVIGVLFVHLGIPILPACLIGLLVGVVGGLFTSFLVVTINLPPFIATLGLMLIARGLGLVISRNEQIFLNLPPGLHFLGLPLPLLPIAVMLVLAVIFHWFMLRTPWGRQITAIGGNEVAARFSGVRVGRIKLLMYLLGGILAGLSGVMLSAVEKLGRFDLATGYELDIIAAAVVGGASLSGGRGSVLGAVIGSLIFGVLRIGLTQIAGAANYERLIVGIVVVAIVIMDQLTARKETKTA